MNFTSVARGDHSRPLMHHAVNTRQLPLRPTRNVGSISCLHGLLDCHVGFSTAEKVLARPRPSPTP